MKQLFLQLLCCTCAALWLTRAESYLIGVGKADVTGPAAEVNMMLDVLDEGFTLTQDSAYQGYAKEEQNAAGIHTRLYARAFVIGDEDDVRQRIVFVNLDAGMASQAVTLGVLDALENMYGGLYNENNLAISGIHTHSGPGGYLQYLLYSITAMGFVKESYDPIVKGIVQAVKQAHESVVPGKIHVNSGELLGASINRSPTAYMNNSESERKQYLHDTDKEMTLLHFTDSYGRSLGSLNWFAVHCTSLNNTNTLISGDNKGAAAQMMEKFFTCPGPGPFVAGFAQGAVGDVSPNTLGPFCMDTGIPSVHCTLPPCNGTLVISNARYLMEWFPFEEAWWSEANSLGQLVASGILNLKPQEYDLWLSLSPHNDVLMTFAVPYSSVTDASNCKIVKGEPCDAVTSTCNGRNELCAGRGPGWPDMFESNRIIADRQFQKAVDLLVSASEEVKGPVDFRHKYVDMTNVTVAATNTTPSGTTCPAAMGMSFAAGTTDGPGAFDFKQGSKNASAFWKLVRSGIKAPSKHQIQCQAPKPVLLDTGEMDYPFAWQPAIVDVQILRVGQIVLLCVPGEFTTMSSRRLRAAIRNELEPSLGELHVVLAGLTNTYSSYVTTYEEYHVQRYEGASTIFGPHTLQAYIQEYKEMSRAMLAGSGVPRGPSPPNLLGKQWSLLPGVYFDSVPLGCKFGDVVTDVRNSSIYVGDTVEAKFRSANPRNDLRTDDTFLAVEYLESGTWVTLFTDDDLSTRFIWHEPSRLDPYSTATVRWTISHGTIPGQYRLKHFGNHKTLFGSIYPFEGTSSVFSVLASKQATVDIAVTR